MLRIEFDKNGNDGLTVRLEGRLVGHYAEHARSALQSHPLPPAMTVDLSEVTFIDSVGQQLLCWLGRLGATFMTGNMYTQGVCENLKLRISEKRADLNSTLDAEALS